jgi:tetratricopeptide (TPR) repeat protein
MTTRNFSHILHGFIFIFSLCALGVFPSKSYAQNLERKETAETEEASGEYDFDKAKKALSEGKAAFKSKQYRKAEKKFRQAFDSYPDPIALYYVGLSQLRQNKCDEASTSLEKAIGHPMGLSESATKKAEKALDEMPKCRERAYEELVEEASRATEEGEYDKAIELLEKAQGRRDDPRVLVQMGHVYLKAEKCQKAKKVYRKSAERTGSNLLNQSAVENLKRSIDANCHPDTDGDGIEDPNDECPEKKEDKDGFEDEDGCPDKDNDEDGIPDQEDECPMKPEDKDGFEDEDGCPDKDNDEDGIPDQEDECPMKPEDKDGFEDEDGCPDKDNDGDGIADSEDECPLKPGDADGFKDSDGCPEYNHKAALALTITGGASLIAGGITDALATKPIRRLEDMQQQNRAANERSRQSSNGETVVVQDTGKADEFSALKSKASTLVWSSRILYGVGALTAITGGSLFVFGDRSKQKNVNIRIIPSSDGGMVYINLEL